jgi:hypothetical protein
MRVDFKTIAPISTASLVVKCLVLALAVQAKRRVLHVQALPCPEATGGTYNAASFGGSIRCLYAASEEYSHSMTCLQPMKAYLRGGCTARFIGFGINVQPYIVPQGAGVLVLDEATSSADWETEGMMTRVIREEFAEWTVLAVAHRLETIRGFDRVAVMGSVVEVVDRESCWKWGGRGGLGGYRGLGIDSISQSLNRSHRFSKLDFRSQEILITRNCSIAEWRGRSSRDSPMA